MSLIAWVRLPEGYSVEYAPHAEGTYWHLFCEGERVNGGLSEDFIDAQYHASQSAYQHKHLDSGPPVLSPVTDLAWQPGRLAS